MIKNNVIDVTPPVQIFEFFKKLSYSVDSAVAELIDNSVASFKDNPLFKSKLINIVFDAVKERIIIRDTAEGIHPEKWARVLRIMEVDETDTRKGYNEFGMGLKTSGFWLGNKIRILTKHSSEENGRKATLDLKAMKTNPKVEITESNDVQKNPFNIIDHGTIIIIDQVDKLLQAQSLVKLVAFFAGKYRNDINKHKIEIRMMLQEKKGSLIDLVDLYLSKEKKQINSFSYENSKKLSYSYPQIYRGKDEKIEKKEISLNISHKGVDYNVTGWVANKAYGQRTSSVGFDLVRRGNVIIQNYSPVELFGQGNSYQTLRMFGELDLGPDIPISQAKDKFDWDDGLEEKIIEAIKNNLDFKEIFKLASVKRQANNDTEKPMAEKDRKNHAERVKQLANHYGIISVEVQPTPKGGESIESDIFIKVVTDKATHNVCSRLMSNAKPQEWIKISDMKGAYKLVEIDVNHAFFNPFNEEKDFLVFLRQFSVIVGITMIEGDEESMSPTDFIEKLGLYLSENLKP